MKNTYNAALLLRDDITTVEVAFEKRGGAPRYTFVITKAMAEGVRRGDLLVAPSNRDPSGLAFVTVKVIHNEPKIDLNVDYRYVVIVGRVSLADSRAIALSTELVADKIRERQSGCAREQLLAQLGLTSDDVKALQNSKVEDMFDEVPE